jgi:pyruvate dehydrogenase E2 component (dihydrolipoamide acetyltransferase)
MAETVMMPKLGFDMAEGTLVRWVKEVGEAVAKGEILAEIETDKATVEVESPFSGVVNRQIVDQGAVVPVGDPIAVIAAPGETVAEAEGGKTEAMPQNAPAEKPETRIAQKNEEGEKSPTQSQKAEPVLPVPGQAVGLPGGVSASPLARKVAQENGVDLQAVQGTGPGGRITRKDVESALRQGSSASTPVGTPTAPPATTTPVPAPPAQPPKTVAWTPIDEIPADRSIEINRLRAAIGKRMTESRQQAPHFYITHIYNVEALMDMRKQANLQLPEEQKLSVNDFIVKAAALALREFPNLNASIQGNQIVQYGHVNIGNAVALEGGLITVVVRDADQKPLRLIARELRETVARARSGKVRMDDIEGSTFSISNLGMFNVDEFVAIINPPEAAILAVGAVKNIPVVGENGEVSAGLRLKATISADHRVTDGAETAQFMQALGRYLENPIRLML